MEKRHKLLLFDNSLIGECNLGCIYCRDKREENRVNPRRLKNVIIKTAKLIRDFFDIPILKISGYGEFFILPNTIDLLETLSDYYERIQIITNATRLNRSIISHLSKIPGINVCVSLDGHTPELNFCRTTDKKLINTILNNIGILREFGIPVEINSVLTKYNIAKFTDFIHYLSRRYDGLICYPFPVRGEYAFGAFGPIYAKKLPPLLDGNKYFSQILPPRAYIERLISFVRYGKRQNKCYIGYANLGIDPAGNILVCACNIKKSIGNIFVRDPILALEKRVSHPWFYKFLFRESLFRECSHCFTHYEIINLYLDGTINLKEIFRIPLFGGSRTQKRLKEIKERVNSFTLN